MRGLWTSVILFLLLAVIQLAGNSAHAIEISCPSEVSVCSGETLWLTGDIERGDARIVARELERRGPMVGTVILAMSAGGSATEAMKIGRLLRKLHIVTGVGWMVAAELSESTTRSFSATVYYPQAASKLNGEWKIPTLEAGRTICSSACLEIWLGGYRRFGDGFLGVHAPSIELAPGRVIPIDHIAAIYRKKTQEIQAYHQEMGAAQSLWQMQIAATGEDLNVVKIQYVASALLNAEPSDENADRPECGRGLPDVFDVWHRKVDMRTVAKCGASFSEELKSQRIKAWDEVFSESDTN